MFKKFLGKFSSDLGIDLGTANTLVYVKDKGIVINEPSIVVINTRTDEILAIGNEAKKMIGKTPPHLSVRRPLEDGIISDFEIAEKMLKYFIDKVHREKGSFFPRPRVVIAIPLELTEVERKAAEDAVLHAGARDVYLIEEPMAAAIGTRLPIQDTKGALVVDIGGGTTEIAVISLGGVVISKSLKLAGDKMNEVIVDYCRDVFNLAIGDQTAEDIKVRIGSASPLKEPLEIKIKGRDLIGGLPKEITINDAQIREALKKTLHQIVENVRIILENTPPELVADIYDQGILLTGGGALLKGLDKLLAQEMEIPVHIADDPLTAVARGTGIVIENLESLKELLVPLTGEQLGLRK